MRISKPELRIMALCLSLICSGLHAQEYCLGALEHKNEGPAISIRGMDLMDAGKDRQRPIEFIIKGYTGIEQVADWTLTVIDRFGETIWQCSGQGMVPTAIPWDGKNRAGAAVSPLTKYFASLSAKAENGRIVFELGSDFITAIPIAEERDRLRVLTPDLLFQGDSYHLFANDPQARSENASILRNLARKVSELRQYRLLIRGFAAANPGSQRSPKDPVDISLKRAAAVRDALYALGVEWPRMLIEGMGNNQEAAAVTEPGGEWRRQKAMVYLIE